MTTFYPISRPSLTALETEYVTRALASGWVSSLGEYIEAFEAGFAHFCGTRHAVSVSNGTVALHLALIALGIGTGDEVVVPDLSFIATGNAVLMTGATPVFADIDTNTLCLSATSLERCISPRTRAVIPVHLYGHPADMAAINAVAERHGVVVIEDAAEAHGAAIGGKRVGALGRCAAFSFYGNKILTTGEGGMITTDDSVLAERCRQLRDHAMSKSRRYWHEELGYNYRITNLQAALGCAQLVRADELLGERRRICVWYREELEHYHGTNMNRAASWATPSCWLTCIEVPGLGEASRAALMQRLRARGVDTRPYFYPMSEMPYMKAANTPVSHAVSVQGFNLPTYLGLTREDVANISREVRAEINLI